MIGDKEDEKVTVRYEGWHIPKITAEMLYVPDLFPPPTWRDYARAAWRGFCELLVWWSIVFILLLCFQWWLSMTIRMAVE